MAGTAGALWESYFRRFSDDIVTLPASLTTYTTDGFVVFFEQKVEALKVSVPTQLDARLPPPPVLTSRGNVVAGVVPAVCTQDEIQRIIMTSPVKSCSLDPVPTFLVRELIDVLLPFITRMVNESF